MPWDDIEEESERLLENDRVARQASNDNPANRDLEHDQNVERDETDLYNEVIFGKRMPDSIAVDWNNKVLYVLEFEHTSDQRHTYRERGESRARAQYDVLVKSLEKVAGQAEGESRGWEIIFVGGTCGSVHAQTLNDNLKKLGVLESKRLSGKGSCMSCLMHKIRSCVHTLRRDQESGMGVGTGKALWKKLSKG